MLGNTPKDVLETLLIRCICTRKLEMLF